MESEPRLVYVYTLTAGWHLWYSSRLGLTLTMTVGCWSYWRLFDGDGDVSSLVDRAIISASSSWGLIKKVRLTLTVNLRGCWLLALSWRWRRCIFIMVDLVMMIAWGCIWIVIADLVDSEGDWRLRKGVDWRSTFIGLEVLVWRHLVLLMSESVELTMTVTVGGYRFRPSVDGDGDSWLA